MPRHPHGAFKKGTKLVLNPKYSDDDEVQKYWGISKDEIYTVVKHFHYNGEMHIACSNGKTYPEIFFVELEKEINK